ENRQLIREVQIDNSIRWQRDHWRTLTSCYNRSPFFEHYATFLTGFYEKHYKWLWDFDLELFHFLAKQMKLARSVSLTQNFEKVPDQAVFDLRGTLRSGKFLITDQRPYAQVFGSDFEKNLSIFDTIFNMGPETSSYLSGHLTI
ncbi:MAG TPA: WbqC family protein, partial [Phnomibacter sp.]|nr:WbqC family protein [Phnomibacter sp.]